MYQKNVSLSRSQIVQEACLKTPEKSLTRWATHKIEHYQENRITTYSTGHVGFMKRIIAFAMPLFAFLDTVRFLGQCLFKLVSLHPRDAKFALFKCGQSLKLFFASIPGAFASIYKPENVFRTEKRWRTVMENQIQKNIETQVFDKKNTPAEQKEIFKLSMEESIERIVLDSKLNAFFLEIAELISSEIPEGEEDNKLIIKTYAQFFSVILVQSARDNLDTTTHPEEMKKVLLETIRVRDPDLKIDLTRYFLSNFFEKMNSITALLNESTQILLPMFLFKQISTNPELAERFKTFAESGYFKDKTNHKKLVKSLYTILKNSYNSDTKNTLISELISCFNKDLQIEAENKAKAEQLKTTKKSKNQIATLEKKLQGARKKLGEAQAKIEKANTEIKALKEKSEAPRILKQKQDQLKVLEKNAATNLANIAKFEEEIAALRQEEKEEPQFDETTDKKESGFANVYLAFSHISILLELESQALTTTVLDKIGEGKEFTSMSDKKIINFLFTKVYELDEGTINDENYKNIEALRAPWALIKFHLRMKNYKGKAHREIVAKSKETMLSILNGTYWEDIHKTENNPHLHQILTGREDLKEKWMNPPQKALVKDLIKDPSQSFKGYTIEVTRDPSDIVLLGDDMNTCMNLNGRISRVLGLESLMADGKTHSIVARNQQGASISAETQIQLMWDEEKQRPVLYLEEVNYEGSTQGDHTLEKAIHKYAKRYAKELELDLVSCWDAHDPTKKLLKENYEGQVVSTGGSCPVEYLNFAVKLNQGNRYKLPAMHQTQKSKTSLVFKGSSGNKNGRTNDKIVQKTFKKISENPPRGIKFNPKKLEGKVTGGICTSQAFKFLKEFEKVVKKIGENATTAEYLEHLKNLGPKFDNGGGESVIKHRSIQEALNTIEVDKKQKGVDFSRNKMQALLNLNDYEITEATETFDIKKDGQGILAEELKRLPLGRYVIRMIDPAKNEKLEVQGHTMILIKTKDGVLFYENNTGLHVDQSNWSVDVVYKRLQHFSRRFNIRHVRFYKIEKKINS